MTNPFRNFLFCAVVLSVLLTSGSFSPATNNFVEVNSGIRKVKACLIGNRLMVWGISSKGGLEIHLYDTFLNEVGAYNRSVGGFVADSAAVVFLSDTVFEVRMVSTVLKKRLVYRLNTRLGEEFVSKPYSLPPATPGLGQKIISSTMTEEYSVQFETRLTHPTYGPQKRVTAIQYWYAGIDTAKTFNGWDITLDSTDAEYGRIFLIRNGRIYLYVNYSAEQQRQFIYCLNQADGKIIYKTRLVVGFTDAQRASDYWGMPKFTESDACIFSNYYWDEKIDRLIIGGTWLADSSSKTGLFLIQLDGNGVIRGSVVNYAYWLSSRTFGGQHSGQGNFSRNGDSYYRIGSMGYQKDGTFTVLSEVHARIKLFKPQQSGNPESIYFQDDSYHYFTLLSQYFLVGSGSIKIRTDDIVQTVDWAANHHLDSIIGFVPGVTKLGDNKSENDINRICDASNDQGCYVASFRDQGTTGIKVLTRELINADGKKQFQGYFTKTQHAVAGRDWRAFLEPYPVSHQDFAHPAVYFAPTSSLLYRVEPTANGYKLSTVPW